MTIKSVVTSIEGSFPVEWLFRKAYSGLPLVVLYHGVTSVVGESGIRNYRKKHLNIKTFERQMDWLSKNFTIVPLREIEKAVLGKKKLEKPICAITFDDGYKNNYLNAFPILKKKNIPAAIFVTTGFIEKRIALWPDCLEESLERSTDTSINIAWKTGGKSYSLKSMRDRISADLEIRSRLKILPDEERQKIMEKIMENAGVSAKSILEQRDYAPLSWEEIIEMSEHNITIGAHTVNHPILSRISKDEQFKEISLSVDKIRAKVGRCEHFAYPNGQKGDWSEETKRILGELKISCAWTTSLRRVNPKTDPSLELPRITLDNTEDFLRFKGLASGGLPFLKSIYHKIKLWETT